MTQSRRAGPLRIALMEIRRHPFRTVLVAQGMVWAIALVVAPAAILKGSQSGAVERARELGTDMIQIGPTDDAKKDAKLAPADADLPFVRETIGAETEMTALRLRPGRLAEIPGPVWLIGADDAVASLRNLDTLAGTVPSFARETSTGREPIPVALEWTLARRLLDRDELTGSSEEQEAARRTIAAEILGSVVTLERSPARIGELVFHPAGSNGAAQAEPGPQQLVLRVDAVVSDSVRRKTDVFGTSGEKDFAELVRDVMQLFGVASNPAPWMADGTGIYLPRRHVPGSQIDWLMVRTHPLEVTSLSDEIEKTLIQRGRSVLVYTNAVLPVISNPELSGYMEIHDVLHWVFLATGAVALANILLLAAHRRRYEIALRRAEGARRADIFMQFLGEGVVIALIGLVAGVVAGMGIAELRVFIDPNVALSASIPWGEIGDAAITLISVALNASVGPAWRACQHDPITLLRQGR